MNDAEYALAKAEADALELKGSYTWSQTSWISLWGFYPVADRNYYISPDNSKLFAKEKFNPWELNAQFNYLLDGRPGILFFTAGYKFFQNNSALADLMTAVDYDQYSQFPGSNPINLAKLETNKAFIGAYDEFQTHNVNLQLVLMRPIAAWVNGGASFRYEKNFGDFSAVNLRLGFPFKFNGKDKPLNIEPQINWKNINNYADKADYKVQPSFGINVGLPFATLFK